MLTAVLIAGHGPAQVPFRLAARFAFFRSFQARFRAFLFICEFADGGWEVCGAGRWVMVSTRCNTSVHYSAAWHTLQHHIPAQPATVYASGRTDLYFRAPR